MDSRLGVFNFYAYHIYTTKNNYALQILCTFGYLMDINTIVALQIKS